MATRRKSDVREEELCVLVCVCCLLLCHGVWFNFPYDSVSSLLLLCAVWIRIELVILFICLHESAGDGQLIRRLGVVVSVSSRCIRRLSLSYSLQDDASIQQRAHILHGAQAEHEGDEVAQSRVVGIVVPGGDRQAVLFLQTVGDRTVVHEKRAA